MVSGRLTGGLASKTNHLICRRGSTHLRLIILCLNVGHELHRAVVSVSRPVQYRCNLGALTFLNVQSYKMVGDCDLRNIVAAE